MAVPQLRADSETEWGHISLKKLSDLNHAPRQHNVETGKKKKRAGRHALGMHAAHMQNLMHRQRG